MPANGSYPSLLSPGELRRIIGQRARAARQSQHLTQANLAAAAGVSTSTIKRFESGDDVALDVVIKVAFALGVETSLLEAFPPATAATFDELTKAEPMRQRVRARAKT